MTLYPWPLTQAWALADVKDQCLCLPEKLQKDKNFCPRFNTFTALPWPGFNPWSRNLRSCKLQSKANKKKERNNAKRSKFQAGLFPIITVLQLMQGGFRKKRKKEHYKQKEYQELVPKNYTTDTESGHVNKQFSRKSVMDGKELIALAQASCVGSTQ